MMTYVYAFLFCGFVCMIAQLILDNTKLTPGHVTSIFVVVGALLDVAILFEAMPKEELFRTVILDGALPRKTFSMGHSYDKRYYLEARKIK